MAYQNFTTLEELHVEVTNRCNAACPMCSRNQFGGKDAEGLAMSDWTSEDAEKVFDPQFLNLKNILFCGTHGDPAAHPNALPFVEIAKKQTNATIEFYSNGSARSKSWWAELGKLLGDKSQHQYYRKTDLGVFSIDGLSDTNSIYRRRTNFEKILENAEAFISTGGHARWDFLVFKHNEHQIEDAEKLAKKVGFKHFRIRKTSRFSRSPAGPNKYPVWDREGNLEYYLEPPESKQFQNQIKNKVEKPLYQGNATSDIKATEIRCLNRTQFQRIYVNARAEVHPCCFLSSDMYLPLSPIAKNTIQWIENRYKKDFNSLRTQNWEDLLQHPFFASDLEQSWHNSDEKLYRCLRTCSTVSNPIISQTQDRPALQGETNKSPSNGKKSV